DGILRRVAGCPSSGSCTSLKNRAAVSSHLLNWAGGKLAIDPNGLLYVSGNGAGEDGLVFIDGGGVLRSALGDAASYLPYGSGQPVSRTLLPTKYPTVSF